MSDRPRGLARHSIRLAWALFTISQNISQLTLNKLIIESFVES